MTSYFVPAYEWAVELTYPEPEGNPTSILHWVIQVRFCLHAITKNKLSISEPLRRRQRQETRLFHR